MSADTILRSDYRGLAAWLTDADGSGGSSSGGGNAPDAGPVPMAEGASSPGGYRFSSRQSAQHLQSPIIAIHDGNGASEPDCPSFPRSLAGCGRGWYLWYLCGAGTFANLCGLKTRVYAGARSSGVPGFRWLKALKGARRHLGLHSGAANGRIDSDRIVCV